MKTSNFTIKLAIFVLFIGVFTYFGFYIYRSLSGGLTIVRAYTETVSIGVEATGLLVREEQVITAATAGSTVELSPSEGEKVAAGGVVATLYASSAGLDTNQSIQLLEAELQQLQYALRSSASATDTAKVEEDLTASIAALHAGYSSGDLTDLEREALQLRTLVFKRDYTYGDAEAAQQLQALIASKSAELDGLRASLGSVSTTLRASRSGVFSGVVDGFESLITPAMLDELTPSRLASIQNQSPVTSSDAVGKLITSSTWYFVASVSEKEAASLKLDSRYTIQFSRDYSGQAEMRLDRVSDAENGRVLLVFSCRSGLSDITLLRRQTVDVVIRQITGICVPRSALRAITEMVTRTVKDEENDREYTVEEEVTTTGVYTVVDTLAEFNPVNVLYQGEDFFLVEPVDPDAAIRLRENDEIIPYTAGITAGRAVRN